MKTLACAALLSFVFLAGASEAATTYTVVPAKSKLEFTFVQGGARNTGNFEHFAVTLVFDPAALPASKLTVKVQLGSVNTQDAERDDGLRGQDFFMTSMFPEATFVSTSIVSDGNDKYRALGKLTIRNTTHEVAVPFTFKSTTAAGKPIAAMKGQLTLRRIDYGVGQGEWKATKDLADEVPVTFDLVMQSS